VLVETAGGARALGVCARSEDGLAAGGVSAETAGGARAWGAWGGEGAEKGGTRGGAYGNVAWRRDGGGGGRGLTRAFRLA